MLMPDPGEEHLFVQVHGVMVQVCWCGKWPMHHIHTGITPSLCTCESCRTIKVTFPGRST